MKVYELLDSPKKWCQGKFALNAEGSPVSYDSSSARQWCLLGAFFRCYNLDNDIGALETFCESVAKKYDNCNVSEFNDSYSYEEVIALCKELDI